MITTLEQLLHDAAQYVTANPGTDFNISMRSLPEDDPAYNGGAAHYHIDVMRGNDGYVDHETVYETIAYAISDNFTDALRDALQQLGVLPVDDLADLAE